LKETRPRRSPGGVSISAKTAETYCGDVLKALDLHDVASLTRDAIRVGTVSSEV
jgi:hypothetical protein